MRRFLLTLLIIALVAVGLWWWESRREVEPPPPPTTPSPFPEPPEREITLYFADSESGLLVSVKRRVQAPSLEPGRAVQELLKGPLSGEKAEAVFPKTAKLLDIQISADIATVNFNESLRRDFPPSASLANLAVYSLVNTLTSLPGIEKVQIEIEGEKVNYLGDVDVSEPLAKDPTVVAQER